MEAKSYKVKWNMRPRRALDSIHDYISEESETEARKVVAAIIRIVRNLPRHPTKYPPDKFRRHNDGTYRAFEKYHCRVAYRILKTEIRIVQVRHTSREPRYY